MNEIKIFNNEEFGQVRTVAIDNEPWFVGKDVAVALGYKDITHTILDHVDEDDRVNSKTQGQNALEFGQRGTWLINESGLYSLILSSKLPSAKRFKHWVTSEVLPSIRKNGGYIMGQESLSDAELMAKALLVAQKTINEREKTIAEQKEKMLQQSKTIVRQEEQIENEKPLVRFALDMQKSENCILIRKAAKILSSYSDGEVKIGEKKLFALLREHKLLMDNKDNEPYQRYKDTGIFTVRANTVNTTYGTVKMSSTTLVTGKGLVYLYGKVREWFGLESDNITLENFQKRMQEAEDTHKYDWLDAI